MSKNDRISNEYIYVSRSHLLQADSAEIMNAWIMAFHKKIDASLQECKGYDNVINSQYQFVPGAKRIKKMYVLYEIKKKFSYSLQCLYPRNIPKVPCC